MAKIKNSIEIDPNQLVITNEDYDRNVVASMVSGLLTGTIRPEDLTMPYVTYVDGTGWCVNDGNHTVKAMQIAKIKSVKVDLY